MKKVNEPSPAGRTPFDDDGDELLPEYDFNGGVRGKYAHLFYEGAKLEINGKPFVVRGRAFVPDSNPRPAKNQ